MRSREDTNNRIRPDEDKVRAILDYRQKLGADFPRYAVFIVSYRAMERLGQVLERIPGPVYEILTEIFIFDDFSPDRTFEVAGDYLRKSRLDKVSLYRNPRNYGYGGNQKLGYEYALAKEYDYVILLHGDGQYAPEYLPDLILPTLDEGARVVFGSRMMQPGAARKGGMPLYKLIGNRVLTAFENFMLGMGLTEFHSGYRLYSTEVLKNIHYKLNTDDFHFDTQIIIQCLAAGESIKEVSIPTYYGDEICHVDGMKYAARVCLSVLDFRLHRLGISRKERYIPVQGKGYEFKDFPYSSHSQVLDLVKSGARVLDMGCGEGMLARPLKIKGCHVTGVDKLAPEVVSAEVDRYVQADISADRLPFDREFDCVIMSDVLEHVAEPGELLIKARRLLKEDGSLVVSVPNIALWVYRLALLAGRFEYTSRGVMDRSHLRFFTLVTARDLLRSAGFNIAEERYASIPFHLLVPEPGVKKALDAITKAYHVLARAWPRMFAYQVIFLSEPVRLEWEELEKMPLKAEEPHPHLEKAKVNER